MNKPKIKIKEKCHNKRLYLPMYTSNGNCISYPNKEFTNKEDAIDWLIGNLKNNNGLQAQIIERRYYTYEFNEKA